MPIMHGPKISDPAKTDERNIPDADVQAYVAVGWVKGSAPKVEKPEAPESEPKVAPTAKKGKK
jgi:hypothetical protein